MRLVQQQHVVPAVWPVDLNTGANAGDYVSMKNYKHLTVIITINTAGGTAVVTMVQAKDVAATGAKALTFAEYWMTGAKWKFTSPSGAFTVGETVTGAGGASGVVAEVGADYILVYTVNATAVVDGETLTGGTSGITATADGIGINEDILLRLACSSTFTTPAVATRTYVIEIDAQMLDVAGDFDCVRLNIAKMGTGSGIGAAVYILSEPRFAGIPMETAIYD